MTISSENLLAHSELGPSAGARWINCPGSVLLCREYPNVDSPYAMAGTAEHTLTEWMREQGKPGVAFLGQTIEVPYQAPDMLGKVKKFVVDQAMADDCQTYVDYVEDWGGDVSLYEMRVHYDAWVPGGFGTSDDVRIRLRDKRCKITDYKGGQGVPVNAKGNIQNRLYALGIYHDLGEWLYEIDDFELGIVQPKRNYIDVDVITVEELLEWANTVAKPAAEIALKPGAPFKAGSWCQFCLARNDCSVRAKAQAEEMFEDLTDLDDVKDATVLSIAKLTSEQKYNLWLRSADIRAFLTDLETHGMTELQHGRSFGDAKLVAGRGGREYIDAEEAEEALTMMIGDDAYTEPKLITPPQAEKKVGKKSNFMRDYVRKTEGKPVMVPGDDPRPALHESRAVEDFDDESGEDNGL